MIVDRNLFVKVVPKQHGALSICFSSDDKEMEDCVLIQKKKNNCLAETKIWTCTYYLSFFFYSLQYCVCSMYVDAYITSGCM